jgi:hypothetical protein
MKRWISCIVNDPKRSTNDANIGAVFGKASAAPDHQTGDNLQPEKLKVILCTIKHFYILLKLLQWNNS